MSEEEEARRNLDKQIREKKLKIRKIKRELRQYRDQKFKVRMTALKARIERINIEGLGRTRDHVVTDTVRKLFHVENFQDIIETTKQVQHELRGLGCFRRVNLYVDTIHETESEQHYQVNIKVQEIGNMFANFGLLHGKQEGELSVVVRGGLNNLGGAGECLHLETTRGSAGSVTNVISLVNPLRCIPLQYGIKSNTFLTFVRSVARLPFMPASQESRELSLGARFYHSSGLNLVSKLGVAHESTSIDWTALANKNVHSWHPVVPYGGDRLLAYFSNRVSLDLLNNPLLPSHGVSCFASLTNGFVPWTGEASFTQVCCGLTAFYPILNTMSLCISGLLSRAASSKEQVPLRFTTDSRLPMVFRGSGDGAPNLYCGDLSHGAYNVALVSKLPLLQSNSMLSQQTRFHAFLTGHAHRNDGLDLKFDQLRNYLGIGVIGRVSDIGRFELNYTVPLGAGKPGLSFSFGTEFI